MTLKEIETAALELPEDERVELLLFLSEHLRRIDPEIEQAWLAETRRRWADIESGKTRTIPGEQVLAEARARLNARL